MDPFDELTRVGTVASPDRQSRPLSQTPGLQQIQGSTGQFTTQAMQSVNVVSGGNPFTDIPPQAFATPPRPNLRPGSAFQVCEQSSFRSQSCLCMLYTTYNHSS